MLALRRGTPALVHGAFTDIAPQHEQVFAYTRTLGDDRGLVALHFGDGTVNFALPDGLSIAAAVLDNIDGAMPQAGTSSLRLAPWQATLYRLAGPEGVSSV